ncbi:hypothetical protein Poly51_39340 [Rubripirellula tenax]|uniref:Uncharacterized protein n=1 Tax=Rubripirellula tenax TaxID=2528015 RepID=A0A5C6ETI8_9BACT|nr:hypothetical protein Poly51_39340 [Rubripirellula tenax]
MRNGYYQNRLSTTLSIWKPRDVRFDQRIRRIAPLRLNDKRLGLLINFGTELIKDGISRIANGMKD